jgi:hypothetical protein
MDSKYVEWLKNNGTKIFYGGGHAWRLYQGALIPASPFPVYIDLAEGEGKRLLKESGTLFIRYSSNPTIEETSWWFVVCDAYSFDMLTSKMRNQIKKAYRNCRVEQLKAEWLADKGYSCYKSAYMRYTNATPVDMESFRNSVLSTSDSDIFNGGEFLWVQNWQGTVNVLLKAVMSPQV